MSSLATVSSIVTYTTMGQFSPSQFEMKYLASIAASGWPSECDSEQPGPWLAKCQGCLECELGLQVESAPFALADFGSICTCLDKDLQQPSETTSSSDMEASNHGKF
ncbi:MAG: hypothetical protein LQ348_003996 [Seirophora lacunosa]|nr:MAG: hypothetical protein LQ348_003996 [Seirophora lacunosa]